ncbi:MAG: hypothetical protein NC293_09015 [Roseburia sp.]|nr:hypothetical protein [Roseburia sp.]
MKAEKDGYEIIINGNEMMIYNKYGCVEHNKLSEEVAEDQVKLTLETFIERHSVKGRNTPACVKKVAFDEKNEEYIQLQAVLPDGEEYWILQRFDNELIYMGEEFTGCRYRDEVQDWMRKKFCIQSCLTAGVYRDVMMGDCTNNGISAYAKELYILSKEKGPFEPEDIRQCVYIEWREVCGEPYINCKPAYFKKHWYMAGGNFLYTSDQRFRDITKSKYPISIHDRYEGR